MTRGCGRSCLMTRAPNQPSSASPTTLIGVIGVENFTDLAVKVRDF